MIVTTITPEEFVKGTRPEYLIAEPAPRANPRGDLMGAWRIRDFDTNRTVARFPTDGRDACERWEQRTGRKITRRHMTVPNPKDHSNA